MPTQTAIKNRNCKVIGYLFTYPNGDKMLKSHTHVVLGYYNKARNVTKDRYHNIIAREDILMSLLESF